MTGLLITIAIIAMLAALPLGVNAQYNALGPKLSLIAGPIRIPLFPKKKKAEKAKEAETVKKPAKQEKKQLKKEESSKTGGSFTDFMPLVHLALDFLGDFRRKLRVNCLEMKLTMAGDDPCDLAVNYGRAWSAVGNVLPLLERFLKIKKRDIQVACDFTAEKTVIYARVDITITLGRMFFIGVRHGIKGLREFLKIMKKRKGGVNYE